ncbi:hypothetical protein [Nocardia sp. NPDC019395]|uniref:hypothetical protein n=1 Tax=Nocardia sp. NPDC019395 TaxID=3154686 RepID=UPI0033DB31AD
MTMGERFELRIEANDDAPFTAMFEPLGMTIDIAAGDWITVKLDCEKLEELRIFNWNGGISIEIPTMGTAYDKSGNEISRL